MPFEDIRITFDVDVSYSVSEFDLFKQKVTTPLFPDGHVVFEIKYNDFLPGWAKKMMNSMKMSNEAVSKYCLAKRNYL